MFIIKYLVKLSLTVDFILVDKRQHDPVADNGALERRDEEEKGLSLRVETSHFGLRGGCTRYLRSQLRSWPSPC